MQHMSLTEIVQKYEIGKNKKEVVILCVPKHLASDVESVLVDGYVTTIRNNDVIFHIYNIEQLSRRTGINFTYKY